MIKTKVAFLKGRL